MNLKNNCVVKGKFKAIDGEWYLELIGTGACIFISEACMPNADEKEFEDLESSLATYEVIGALFEFADGWSFEEPITYKEIYEKADRAEYLIIKATDENEDRFVIQKFVTKLDGRKTLEHTYGCWSSAAGAAHVRSALIRDDDGQIKK